MTAAVTETQLAMQKEEEENLKKKKSPDRGQPSRKYKAYFCAASEKRFSTPSDWTALRKRSFSPLTDLHLTETFLTHGAGGAPPCWVRLLEAFAQNSTPSPAHEQPPAAINTQQRAQQSQRARQQRSAAAPPPLCCSFSTFSVGHEEQQIRKWS